MIDDFPVGTLEHTIAAARQGLARNVEPREFILQRRLRMLLEGSSDTPSLNDGMSLWYTTFMRIAHDFEVFTSQFPGFTANRANYGEIKLDNWEKSKQSRSGNTSCLVHSFRKYLDSNAPRWETDKNLHYVQFGFDIAGSICRSGNYWLVSVRSNLVADPIHFHTKAASDFKSVSSLPIPGANVSSSDLFEKYNSIIGLSQKMKFVDGVEAMYYFLNAGIVTCELSLMKDHPHYQRYEKEPTTREGVVYPTSVKIVNTRRLPITQAYSAFFQNLGVACHGDDFSSIT